MLPWFHIIIWMTVTVSSQYQEVNLSGLTLRIHASQTETAMSYHVVVSITRNKEANNDWNASPNISPGYMPAGKPPSILNICSHLYGHDTQD